MDVPKEMVVEHFNKLKDHLYYLDGLVNASRRVLQFKTMEPGWSGDNVDAKMSEVEDACKKNELLIKLGKNLLTSLKSQGT